MVHYTVAYGSFVYTIDEAPVGDHLLKCQTQWMIAYGADINKKRNDKFNLKLDNINRYSQGCTVSRFPFNNNRKGLRGRGHLREVVAQDE